MSQNDDDISFALMFTKLFLHRLDAGTFGTMGVGTGYAIAAAMFSRSAVSKSDDTPDRVVCIQGDSAFGFSGMELETACRYYQIV